MDRLEKKLIECLALRSLKQDLAQMQKWDDAARTREAERISAREFHNMLSGSSDDGHDWVAYEKSVKEYCEKQFGTHDAKSILKIIDRREKLKKLGI